MAADTNTLVKMLRDIFITPYQYSDFDEGNNETCLPKATLKATGAPGYVVSELKPAAVCVHVPLEAVSCFGEGEVRKSTAAGETSETKKDPKAEEGKKTYEDRVVEGKSNMEEEQKKLKGEKEAEQSHTVKVTRIPTSARGRSHIHSSGNDGKEVRKRKSKRELAHDFESELIKSSVRNILQKHILRATRDALAISNNSAVEDSQRDLTQFHFFSRLPAELRFNIWALATCQPRIIAVQSVPKLDSFGKPCTWPAGEGDVNPRQRYISGLHSKSRTPALLQVNRESRKESLKYYKRRCLSGYSHGLAGDYYRGRGATYYINLHYDVVMISYYGDIIDRDWAWRFIQMSDEDFPKIAVELGRLAEGRSHLLTLHARLLMRELHGMRVGEGPDERQFGNVKGLKEVFFVVATKLSAMNASELGHGTSFRPAGIDGSTRAQINFKYELEKRVQDVAEDRPISLGRQQVVNAWVGDNKPAFSFVSLAPVMSWETKTQHLPVVSPVNPSGAKTKSID